MGTILNSEEEEAEPLTASFTDVPAEHGGPDSEGFSFRVGFSEEIPTSYRTLRDDSFTVVAGEVTRARRVDTRSDLWDITVVSDSRDAVVVSLPADRPCEEV